MKTATVLLYLLCKDGLIRRILKCAALSPLDSHSSTMSWEEKPGPGPGIILSNKYRSDGCYTFPEEPLKSYYKNLTLQKNYGSTGSVETVDGAFYIGMLDIWTTTPSVF